MSPFVFVLFGATGDLARHKLFPALFSLFQKKLLGEKFYIVGYSRREYNDLDFKKFLEEVMNVALFDEEKKAAWEAFLKNIYYQQGLFDTVDGYNGLIQKLNGFDKEIGACITRLFYLATPPDNYNTILKFLDSTELDEGCGQGSNKWTRIAIEKPFGKDLETAKSLDKMLSEVFEERQIFRVDHYLAKETVQNMIAFRFANGIFEPMWNKQYIDHVQITWAEKKGVAGHTRFFDGVGMLRDVAQNHLMQLLATVVMEQPTSFSKEAIRDARSAAIRAIEPIDPSKVSELVVRGQYDGYKQEKNVEPNSDTETFVAMKFFVKTERFKDVPFYVRAGKKMAKDSVSISIVFRQTCHILFKEYGCPEEGNILTIRIQPDEGITLRVIAKAPGNKLNLNTVDMKFNYHDTFGNHGVDAYEKLLMDILVGDQMLFNRSDELESSWQFITNILEGWTCDESGIKKYESGTWGPQEADELIKKDLKKWI